MKLVVLDQLEQLGWYMWGQLGTDVQRVEYVHVFFEIVGAGGVEQHLALKRRAAHLLNRDG